MNPETKKIETMSIIITIIMYCICPLVKNISNLISNKSELSKHLILYLLEENQDNILMIQTIKYNNIKLKPNTLCYKRL